MKTATQQTKPVLSRPTMCLHCHLVVEMSRGEKAWMCPHCGESYPFKWWKIKPGGGIRALGHRTDAE